MIPSMLLEALLEAPYRPDGWAEAMELLRRHIGGSAASMLVRSSRDVQLPLLRRYGTQLPEPVEDDYRRHYFKLDPSTPQLRTASPGEIVIAKRRVSKSALDHSEFYQEWARPNGLGHAMNVVVCDIRGRSFVISLSREHEATDFDDAELRKLKQLLPYLRNSFVVESHLEKDAEHSSLVSGMLEAFAEAAFILDCDNRVVTLNQKARQLLEEENLFRIEFDRLQVHDREQDERLARWLQPGSPLSRQACLLLRRADGAPALRLVTAPMPSACAARGERMLFVRPLLGDPSIIPERELKFVFGLTTVEARLVARLARAETLEAAAAALSIAVGTARNHLKQVFAKLRVNRQTELIALVLGLTPSVGLTGSTARNDDST